MADTKLIYKENKGFWIEESFMQLILFYITQEITKPQQNIPNKADLLEDLNWDIQGYTQGYMNVGLFEYVVSPSDEETMVQILQNVKTTLQNKGAYISVAELQLIPTEDDDFKRLYSRKPFPVAELVKIVDALIQMLEGTWTSTNYNMIINYGYYN